MCIQRCNNEKRAVFPEIRGYLDMGLREKIDCGANERPVFEAVKPQNSLID